MEREGGRSEDVTGERTTVAAPRAEEISLIEQHEWRSRLDAGIDETLSFMRLRYDAAVFAFDEALARRRGQPDDASDNEGGWQEGGPMLTALLKQRQKELNKLAIFENHPSEKNFHEALSSLRALEAITVVDGNDGLMELDREWYLERSLSDSLIDLARRDRPGAGEGDFDKFETELLSKVNTYRQAPTRDAKVVALADVRDARHRAEEALGIESLDGKIDIDENKIEKCYREASLEEVENELIAYIHGEDEGAHPGAAEENVTKRRAKELILRRRGAHDEELVSVLREMHVLASAIRRAGRIESETKALREQALQVLGQRFHEGVLSVLEDRFRDERELIATRPEFRTDDERNQAFRRLVAEAFATSGFGRKEISWLVDYFEKSAGI